MSSVVSFDDILLYIIHYYIVLLNNIKKIITSAIGMQRKSFVFTPCHDDMERCSPCRGVREMTSGLEKWITKRLTLGSSGV